MSIVSSAKNIFLICILSALLVLAIPYINRQLGSNVTNATDSSSLETLENKTEIHNVLLFSSWAEHLPWAQGVFHGVEQALAEQTNDTANLFTEYLDYSRLGQSVSDEELAEFLHNKYRHIPLDGVIVDSNRAVNFILNYGYEIFGDLPYVLYAGELVDASRFSTYATINIGPAFEKTVQLALHQNPGTEHILLIGDGSPQLESTLKAISQAIRSHQPGIEIIVKTDFTIDELEQAVRLLPNDSLVLFTLVFQDRLGQSWRPVDVISRVANSASVPIYVFHEPLIGSGAVGGYVQKSAGTGEVAVKAIYDLSRQYGQGEDVHLEYDSAGMVLDWRALQKWNIPPSLVPEDAEIRYRKPFVWQAYFKETILALLAILIQTISFLAITVLFLQRRQLSQRLLTLNQQLEQRVADRTQMLHQMSICDDLTGIDNRKEFYRKANSEFKRFKRFEHSFTLAILDIDKFKAVNDTYGHLAGDRVLASFAQEIASFIREIDIWGRIGGEEFALLLPNTMLSDGVSVLEKIRQHIQDCSFVLPNGQVINITVSIGAVGSESFAQKIEDLVHNADQRLYYAKANGRNQITYQEQTVD